jgi:rhodanese-related sulfurtransferase
MHTTHVPAVDVDTAAASGDLLLDVREHREWMAGHAPAAVHVPMAELADRMGELPRGRRIVCVCRSGNRSARVTAWLASHGFDAVNLTGGMQRWASFGHPVVNHAGNPGTVI